MKSLILTSLYLLKDTLYRWKERPSSPLSRLLVVFFLSLCALSFLANYVLSTKAVQAEIKSQGGDLIVMSEMEMADKVSKVNVVQGEIGKLCPLDLVILNEIGQGEIDSVKIPIAEYPEAALSHLSDLGLEQHPYLALVPEGSIIPEAPARLTIHDYTYDLVVRKMPKGHILEKNYERGIVLLPLGVSYAMGNNNLYRKYIIRVKEMTHANVFKVDYALRNLAKLDSSFASVFSSEPLLAKLDVIMNNQNECRAGFSIGIAVIVGILLTTLSSMEFRENEYVYTLMKSFGVRPIYLVLSFIMENIFLVGISFVSALFFFIEAQKIIMTEFFKLRGMLLSFTDLHNDIFLLSVSLFICVMVSAIPIIASAYREIGRILK